MLIFWWYCLYCSRNKSIKIYIDSMYLVNILLSRIDFVFFFIPNYFLACYKFEMWWNWSFSHTVWNRWFWFKSPLKFAGCRLVQIWPCKVFGGLDEYPRTYFSLFRIVSEARTRPENSPNPKTVILMTCLICGTWVWSNLSMQIFFHFSEKFGLRPVPGLSKWRKTMK